MCSSDLTWSPVELVMESRLTSKLSGDFSEAATAEAAAEAARQVKGRWKTYYAMQKSPTGMNFSGMPMLMSRMNGGPQGSAKEARMAGGTNGGQVMPNVNALGSNLEEAFRRQKLEDLARLTPEQRVQRARERGLVMQKQ